MADPLTPPQRTSPIDDSGRFSDLWYRYFLSLTDATAGDTTVAGDGPVVESVTGSEIGVRGVEPDTRLEYLTVGIAPVLASSAPGQSVTYWISADDGATFVWIGSESINAGTVIDVRRFAPGTASNWKVAAAGGVIGGNPTPIDAADLPAAAKISASFAVAGLELAAGNAVTNASVLAVAGTGHQVVTRTREDNSKYGEMGLVQFTEPIDNSFFVRITVQELDAAHLPLTVTDGTERPFDGFQISAEGGEVRQSSILLITYKANLAYIRVRIYVANRNSSGTWDFQDPTTNKLQTCWAAGADHFDVPVTIVAVNSVSATEAGSRYAAPDTRLVHTFVDITPVFDVADLPSNVTYWISADNGANYVWIGWQLVETVGQAIRVDRLAPGVDQNWKVAVAAGTIGGDPTAIAAADLPDSAVQSASFLVAATATPSATLLSSLTVSAGVGGANPYNVVAPPRQYWSINTIAYDDTPCLGDANAFFVRITTEDLDASFVSVRGEEAFAGTQVSESGTAHTFGPLQGEYGAAPNRSGNINYVRFRVYVINRNDQTTTSFTNPLAATLQTGIGGGAGYVDVLVGPTPPPLASPSGIYTDVITGGHISPDLANGFTHQVFLDSGTPIVVDDPIYTGSSITAGLDFSLTVYQDATGSRPDPTFGANYYGLSGTAISSYPLSGSTYFFRVDGSLHFVLIAFQPGIGITTAPAAPNVSFASTPTVSYALVGNGTRFGFSGTLNLPTTDPDFSNLREINIIAYGPAGQIVPICTLYASQFSGTTIAFSGGLIPQAATAESWSLIAWAVNDDNIASLAPASVTLTINAAAVSAVTAVDASTLSPLAAGYAARFQDAATALHTVLNVTITLASAQYPQVATIWIDKQDGAGPRWQGWFGITGAAQRVQLGLPNTNTDVYPPGGAADGSWLAIVAAGPVPKESPVPGTAITSSAFTVPTIPAPGATMASHAYIDEIVYGNNGQVNTWGWKNLFVTLPYDDPNLFFARWTVQNGNLTGSTFTPGSSADAAQHDGREVVFTDDDGGGSVTPVLREPGTNKITIQNHLMWTLPGYKLADGTLNPNSCFRFRMYAATRRDTDGSGGTLVQQSAWSTGVGDSSAGVIDHFDVVLDLTKAQIPSHSLNPDMKVPGEVVPLGEGMDFDGSNVVLNAGAGLNFDVTGKAQINAGAGIGFDVSGKAQINAGAALGVDVSNNVFVRISGPLYVDVSNNVNLRIAADFVVTSVGGHLTLSQNVVDLAKSVNFDTGQFDGGSGTSLVIKALAVNKLIAGDALFAGTATFAYNGGGKVTLNSGGLTLADHNTAPSSTVTIASTGITLARSSNSVAISASGLTISEANGAAATFNSSGVSISRSSNAVAVTSSGITIVRAAGGAVNLDSSGVSVQNGSNSVAVSSTNVTITGPSGTFNASAAGVSIANANSSVVASSAGITITGNTAGVTTQVNINSAGFSASNSFNSVAISSTAVTITKSGTSPSTLTMDATGLKLINNSNQLLVSSGGITVTQNSGAALNLDATGITISKGAYSVSLDATGVTINYNSAHGNRFKLFNGGFWLLNAGGQALAVMQESVTTGGAGVLAVYNPSNGNSIRLDPNFGIFVNNVLMNVP